MASVLVMLHLYGFYGMQELLLVASTNMMVTVGLDVSKRNETKMANSILQSAFNMHPENSHHKQSKE